jgi:hypothetical protein
MGNSKEIELKVWVHPNVTAVSKIFRALNTNKNIKGSFFLILEFLGWKMAQLKEFQYSLPVNTNVID